MTDTPETDDATLRAIDIESCGEFDAVHVQVAKRLERERDEWQINALLKLAVKQLACMWCGEVVHAPTGYEPGTPLSEEQRGQAYREHVATCQKHPIRDVERERDEAREERDEARQWESQALVARIQRDEFSKTLGEVREILCDALPNENQLTSFMAVKLARERDEWKAKYIQQNKDLGCELMDPNGTIWDHAKKLQAELDAARKHS